MHAMIEAARETWEREAWEREACVVSLGSLKNDILFCFGKKTNLPTNKDAPTRGGCLFGGRV